MSGNDLPDLRSLQAAFAAALIDDRHVPGAGLVSARGLTPRQRLNVYFNHSQIVQTEALAAIYPAVSRLVGGEFFAHMAVLYGRRHPADSGDLRAYGTRLPEFIEAFEPLAALPYIADVARLEAESNGTDLVFPDGFETEPPTLAHQARELHKNRVDQLQNDLDTQKALINQRERERDEISARLANTKKKLKLISEQVRISENLLKKDLTNRMLHLNLLKEQATLQGTLSEDTAALNRLSAAIEQERLNLTSVEGHFRIDAREALDDKRRSLEEFTNRVRKYEDSYKRSVLTAPVEGVVMTLHVVTEGGVIPPGGKVVDIVPVGDALVVEAKLLPQDVGFIHVGQVARVKLAAAGSRFQPLDGVVSSVSPDTVETKTGKSYYKVRIKTDRDYFDKHGQRYQLVPGVQVMCSIVTGTRSVMEYITTPFYGAFSTALQER